MDAAGHVETVVRDALDAAGHRKAVTTRDGRRMTSAQVSRNGGVLVTVPTVEYPTYGEAVAEWHLYLVAGPLDRPLEAFDRIDALLDALHAAELPITRAEPAAFSPIDGQPLPALDITMSDI